MHSALPKTQKIIKTNYQNIQKIKKFLCDHTFE